MSTFVAVKNSVFKITQMDCPSEERMIRMKLAEFDDIQNLEFDTPNRKLVVFHAHEIGPISAAIVELKLGAELEGTEENVEWLTAPQNHAEERRLLLTVLTINFFLFVIEMVTGLISASMGLVADSLDMLADVAVYGMSLYAVGRAASKKKRIARISGYFQMTLAVLGLAEVRYRYPCF